MIIGLTQSLTAGYQQDIAPWLGDNFGAVMPYVVMILILLVRPYGLYGTQRGAACLMARPHRYMTRRYADELRLFRTRWAKAWAGAC